MNTKEELLSAIQEMKDQISGLQEQIDTIKPVEEVPAETDVPPTEIVEGEGNEEVSTEELDEIEEMFKD